MADVKNTKATTTHQAPEGFEKVIVDMPSFKPEPFSEREGPGSEIQIYNGKPLQGEILGARNFGVMKDSDNNVMTNENGETNDIIGLVVKLEADVDVIDRDKKPFLAKAGETILWFATVKVRQAITQTLRIDTTGGSEESNRRYLAALNGRYGLRFWCMPQKKEPNPKNAKFKIWSYDFHLHPTPVERKGTNGIAQFFSYANAPELGAAAVHGAPNGGTVLAGDRA
jgi:hypothetical protein